MAKFKSKLSEPITYSGGNLEERINNGMTHLRETFLNKDIKPKLYGKRIYFDMTRTYKRCFIFSLPVLYLHIISLGDDEKFDILPCTNDEKSYELCANLCEKESDYYCFKCLKRWECPYRLARIHWIPEVIKLANENATGITYWEKEEIDKTSSKTYINIFLRYTVGMDDFVIIFRTQDNNEYVFVSAYPVCSRRFKKNFDKDYKTYCAKTKEPEI